MAEWKEQEITEMLAKIFPPKPAPVQSELSPEMVKVIEIAREMGLTFVPPVVIVDNRGQQMRCSCVTFHDYSETAIEIVAWNEFIETKQRTPVQMARSLAHELGHCKHMQDGKGAYESWGFKNCEDFATEFADQVMARI